MTSVRWKTCPPSTGGPYTGSRDAARRLAGLLHAGHVELEMLCSESGAFAFIVGLAHLRRWADVSEGSALDLPPSESANEQGVIFVDSSVQRENLAALLRDILSRRLPVPVPGWAASCAETRSPEAYRRAGEAGRLRVSRKGEIAPLSFQLFPISLDPLSDVRQRLTPDSPPRPEPDGNLKRRGDWFQRQFGDKK